jgi:dimethylargininase
VNPGPGRALVRGVSPLLADAELTFLERGPIDPDRAAAQHAAYCDLLTGLGVALVRVPAADEHPDGTFVEDVAVVVDELVVLTRPGATSRRGEVSSVAAVVEGLGLRTASIEAPATLDGGDVLQVGRTVFVGVGGRTNSAAVAQLTVLLAPLGRTVVPVDVTGCLHLKTGATALPDGTVLAVREWLDTDVFTARGHEVVQVPEVAGADILLVGDHVVLSAAAPDTAALVAARGFAVHPVGIDELERAEAGPTCLSVLLPPA